MRSVQLWKIACPILFLLVIGIAAYQRNQRSKVSTSTGSALKGNQSREQSLWVSGWGYCLLPIASESQGTIENSREVWNELFPRMARDEKTGELLTQLHGGWPTQLIVIDANQADDRSSYKEPPPAGMSIVLRVTDLKMKDVKTNLGQVPFREIAFGHVVQIRDSAIAELPIGMKEPLPGDALDLAIEEFLLREAPTCIVRRATGPNTSFEDDQQLRHAAEKLQLPVSVEEQRRELEERIKIHVEQAKAYYGRMR